jgi:superfamily II DNA or RNA helicase
VVHNCGKTITFLAAIKALNRKTLVLAHRNELVRQTKDKALKLGFSEEHIGECSFERKDFDKPLVIGSIQTAIRHLPKLLEADFQCLVIDEAHHAASDTYQELIYHLNFFDGSKYLLGFTATPIRGDHLSLGDTFPDWVYKLSLEDAIRNGYISDIRGVQIAMNADLGGIKKTQGDYTIKDLEREMNTLSKNKIIGKTYLERAEGKKAIAFCCTVKHARDLTIEMSELPGIKPALITGEMDMTHREQVYTDFKNGVVNVLCSCMVLTEGFDVPDVECILMCRPTASPGLYRQMIGRGLRKHPGKKECLVLEFTSNDRRMLTLEDISPEKRIRYINNDRTIGETIQDEEDKEAERIARLREVYAIEVEIYDPLDRANKPVFASITLGEGNFFIPFHGGFFWGSPISGKIAVLEFLKAEKLYTQEKNVEVYSSYEIAIDHIQKIMKKRHIRKFYPLAEDDMSVKQQEVLVQYRIPCDNINKREASKRIERLFITKYLNKSFGKSFPYFEQ